MANPTSPEGTVATPVISAGQHVYLMEDTSIHVTNHYDTGSMYRCHTAGVATRDSYNLDIRSVRSTLNIIKDRGTVFQDQFERLTPQTATGNSLDSLAMASSPADPRAIQRVDLTGPTSQVVPVWQDNTIDSVQPVQPMSDRNLFGVRPPDNMHTHENDQLAVALDLIKAQEEGIVERLKVQSCKDLNGQYLVCSGCVNNQDNVFPGTHDMESDSCIQCKRRSRNTYDTDHYMTKDTRDILFQLFAKEVIPEIKKQALIEAKVRISEAEEKENKTKRVMARIAKKRA